jgi:hypothetical protein
MAIDIQNTAWSNRERTVLAELKDSQWASFILNFAEVHLKTGGILQELVDSIRELIEDLETELTEVTKNFARRTDNHNRDVIRLEQEIADAAREIFNGNDMIDNVLFPTRRRYQQALNQLKDNIEQNRKALDEETLQRKNDHEAYVARAAEHQMAIDAIDECLQLLGTLTNPALMQVQSKRIQQNLAKVEHSFRSHDLFGPLIRALMELATEQNFADQGALGQIVKAFNELRVEIVNALNQENADEAEKQAEFEEREANLNAEHASFQRDVLIKNAELTACEEKITETSAFVDQRKVDQATLQAQLDAENTAYAQETEIFEALVAQYQRELGAAEKALEMLTQPSFEDYVKSSVGF